MGAISITSEKEGFTNISNNFIKYYMTDANGDFVKLYLYLAMLCSTNIQISVSDIADNLSCSENDVCRAIRYWIKADALSLCYNDSKEVTGIILKSLKSMDIDVTSDLKVVGSSLSLGNDESRKTKSASSYAGDEEATEDKQKAPKKKQPTPQDLEKLQRDPDIENLISEAKAYCNRDLGPKEMNSLIYIKDQLSFSFDLCEYLLEYCASVKKTSFAYIEKVARNWYEEGITTRDEAEEYTERYMTLYGKILKSLGITNRISPAPIEKKYIDTWTKEYDFSTEIIIEACNRAISQKPNDVTFPYVNGILENWHKNEVHTFSDISKLDENHSKKTKKNTSGDPMTRNNKDKLKALEDFYLKKGNDE
ncbi:MAG: DnaD domain protein [Eubacterium sp.]|nr:DnaD domain protein [Eubacterium sp.]